MKSHTTAPRKLRLKSISGTLTLPPGAMSLIDSCVGTYLGDTRAGVLRFAVLSWLLKNATKIPVKQDGLNRRSL